MTEANVFSTLLGLQLYAEHGYSLNPDRETVMRRFEFCCQTSAKAFFALDRVDRIKPKDPLSPDPAKYCMWQDILMGMFDENMKDYNLTEHYTNLSKEMAYYESHGCRYSFIFRYIRKLSDVLAIKGDLGKKITKAYHENDKEYLKEVVEVVLPELKEKVRILWEDHMNWFFEINKPQGWEIMDIRYGGVMARIDSVKSVCPTIWTVRSTDWKSWKKRSFRIITNRESPAATITPVYRRHPEYPSAPRFDKRFKNHNSRRHKKGNRKKFPFFSCYHSFFLFIEIY